MIGYWPTSEAPVVISYNKTFYLSIKQGKEKNRMGTKPPLKNGHGAKNMKVNGSHYHVSPTPRRDLI